MWINSRLTTYLQSNYSTDANNDHQNGFGEHVSHYWWCENMRSWLYSQKFFHCGSMQPCEASLYIHYNGNRRRQLYWSNVMDWPLPPQYKKRPMYWSTFIYVAHFLNLQKVLSQKGFHKNLVKISLKQAILSPFQSQIQHNSFYINFDALLCPVSVSVWSVISRVKNHVSKHK